LYPVKTSEVPLGNEDTSAEDVTGTATEIVAECLKLLSEPEKSQATYAAQVLSIFLSTTPFIAAYTVAQTVPNLLKIFRDPDEAPNRRSLLIHLAAFVNAARQSTLAKEFQLPLIESYKDEVLGAFTTGLKASAALPSLEGLESMVMTPGLLTDEEMGYVVHSVNDMLSPFFSPSDTPPETDLSDETTDGALALLTTVASSSSGIKHVEALTLPMLFLALPDVPYKREEEVGRQRAWRVLEFLSKLCVASTLFDTLVVRLLAKVDLSLSDSLEQEIREAGVAYAHAAMHTLATVLEKKVAAKHADVSKHIHKLVPHLYGLFVASSLSPDTAWSVANEDRLVSVAGRIVGLVVQVASAS
jgi:DNA repair/transcription protein MET18/MMS19